MELSNTSTCFSRENLSTEELASEFSDYYKSFYGIRPRFVKMDDRKELLYQLKRLDETIEHLQSTPEGLKILQADGWV